MSVPPSVPPSNRSVSRQAHPSSLPVKSNSSPDAALETVLDAALYKALQQGNPEALGELYNRHARLVYGISLKVLGQAQAAEDLTQEIFLTLVRTDGYDAERSTLRTYLAILTRSRALDRLRSRGVAAQDIARLQRQQKRPVTQNIPLENATQSETRAEQTVTIQTAMAQLSMDEQQILRMMYFEGLSQAAIAQSLSIPLGTIKTQSRRGLLKLRDILNAPAPPFS